MEDLKQAFAQIERPGSLSAQQANEFLNTFPLESIFRALSNGEIQAFEVASTLSKVLEVGKYPPDLLHYAVLALRSPEPALRKLGARQIAVYFQRDEESLGNQLRGELADKLLGLIEDENLGVANTAHESLMSIARSLNALMAHWISSRAETLQKLIQSENPVIRMRAISLVADLSSTSDTSASIISSTGLFNSLSKEISQTEDVLGCASALQIVLELSSQLNSQSSKILEESLLPALQSALHSKEAFLSSQASEALAALTKAHLTLDGRQNIQDENSLPGWTFENLQSSLDINSESSTEDVAKALKAMQIIASSDSGQRAVLAQNNILKDVARICAESNSNSSIAMETFSMLLGTPKAENTSADTDRQILLDPEIDDKLRQYLYQACGQNTPAELLWKKLKQPFHTAKLAVYRLCLGLAYRDWGAREICSYSDLITHLCNPKSESNPACCYARFDTIKALFQTAMSLPRSSYDVLTGILPQLERSVKNGPFGSETQRSPMVDLAQQ